MSPYISGWVLEIGEGRWTIRVNPMYGHHPPYEVRVISAGGIEIKHKIGCPTVEAALEDAGSTIALTDPSISTASLMQIGQGMDLQAARQTSDL